MSDKVIDEDLGISGSLFKTPAQDLVNSGQCPTEKPKLEIANQQDWGDLNDAERDYEYQRQNFYNLVERGTDAVEGILELAKESDHPRAYEVAGNLIKQVAEVTEKLGDLQEKNEETKRGAKMNAPKNVTNALFVKFTAELQKMLKEK